MLSTSVDPYEYVCYLLSPSVITVRVGTHIIQSHLSFCSLGVRLKKH